jgi:hypothetical protein
LLDVSPVKVYTSFKDNKMIPKSIIYKLVRKSDGLILAEGNKKEMHRLQKKIVNTRIWISASRPMVGEYLKAG